MKIGLCQFDFRMVPLEECISKIAAMGFDGVEVGALEYQFPTNGPQRLNRIDIDKAYRKKIKELIESKGLTISDIAGYNDFLTPSYHNAQIQLITCKHYIDFALDMDVDLIRTHLVSLLTYAHYPDTQRTSLTTQYAQGVELLKEYVKMAEDAGVVLGLDNHFFLTVLDHLKIVREINSPNLKIFIDVINCVENGEDLIKTARACGDLLVHSHVKEEAIFGSKASRAGEFTVGVPIGEGVKIDWEAYLKVLKEINYKGFLSLETHTPKLFPMGLPDWEAVERGLKYLRSMCRKVGV